MISFKTLLVAPNVHVSCGNPRSRLEGHILTLVGEVKYVYLPGREDREIFLEVERCRW
jgi:hypothetical protein